MIIYVAPIRAGVPAEYKKGGVGLVACGEGPVPSPIDMIRYGNLYDKIYSFENLFLASRKARKGKRTKKSVMSFEAGIEDELLRLQKELVEHTYRPGRYREFTIYERKPRKISAAPYRDRVVHHALCNIVEPIFEGSFIFDSYACRKGKGTHRAVDRFTNFARKNRYVLKCDIKKYFPSMDHEILFEKIKRKIKCRDTLWLIREIIDHSNPQAEVYYYFEDDDLFEPFSRRRGIPIGNLTSQFFANIYLNDLDHYVKEILKCPYYIRYVDDFVVFGNCKKRLWQVKERLTECLQKDRLKLHPVKTFVSPVNVGIDHLGYRVYPTHRLIRKDISMRFLKKLRKMSSFYRAGSVSWAEINTSVQSWLGHAGHADTFGLRKSFFGRISFSKYRDQML